MNNLLAIEWLKIRRYRVFWVMLGIFMVLLPLWISTFSNGMMEVGDQKPMLPGNPNSFPYVWENVGWWGSVFVIFLSILVITLTCNEFTFRTHRQNVIDGWSRLDFFHAKLALVAVLSACATVFVFLTGLTFGLSNSTSSGTMFEGIEKMGYFFLLLMNYMSAALLVALLVRRSGMAIALFLLYAMIIDIFLSKTINKFTDSQYGNLMPLQSSDELLPWPIWKQMAQMMGQTSNHLPDYSYVLASCFWILIYYFAGRMLILKRDM